MICQNCNINEATAHIKKVAGGKTTQTHLCSSCYKNLNYDKMLGNFSLNLPSIFANFFGDSSLALSETNKQRCEKCGCSFDEIIKTGKVGCAGCYDTFYDKLLPSIQRIHGRCTHAGKVPENIATIIKEEKSVTDKIQDLQDQMNQAVSLMEFEKAAIIRDEIKKIKGEL